MSAESSAGRSVVRELTVRGIVIGGLITLVFTAANVYLGLKVGLTFATSIPAAVISMAVLRYFADHSVVENNIVQTIASAAGTLSAIIFVLPGLVIVGWWNGFPYWTTMAVCLVGGILGVAYSIPLRRALVTGSDLPYPEGVAGAEVLKVGDTREGADENKRGLRVIIVGSLAAAAFSLLAALKVVAGSLQKVFHVGSGGTMIGSSLSLALIGVGHLVGLGVGIAMIVGLLISFGVLLPIKSSGHLPAHGDITDAVSGVFATDVRFIGAGAIAVAAVWTLLKIIGPIIGGIKDAIVSNRARQGGEELDVTERDMPITIVAGIVLLSLIPIALLLWGFAHDTNLRGSLVGLIVLSLIFVLLIGLVVAAVCGYMAGLIGSSNSPISGVGILVVLAAALLIKAMFGGGSGAHAEALVAFTLFTAAIVFGVATISNDNLQDLKTGQLVGSTPWKQQVALVIGVVFGSLVIPPIMDLMNNSFGFLGAPGAGKDALAAPQASLISSLAKGVFGGSLDWGLIGLGAAIGVVVIVIDEVLGKTTGRLRLPPLAVGMGMYLPISLTLMIPLGAVIGTFYDRWADRNTANPVRVKRLGVLVATGFIVGESLFGVLLAAIVAATGKDSPLAVVGDGFLHWSEGLGAVLFVVLIAGVYQWTRKVATAGDEVAEATS
ncbi:OPT family oligopeptide transporter [Flexivirga sp.]|uniref:OPT family oligopeptide transporter n=1 Tax=Flexivirga sp. TaxID=1962927 RepID=UPI003F7E5CFC